jgi:hypothetical protein
MGGYRFCMRIWRHQAREGRDMIRIITSVAAALLLGGCGLAETGAAAAAGGHSAAEQAKEAEKITSRVEADLESAQQQAAEARRAAEAASE